MANLREPLKGNGTKGYFPRTGCYIANAEFIITLFTSKPISVDLGLL